MFCSNLFSNHCSNGSMSVAGSYLNQHWFSTNSNSLEIKSGNGMWFKLGENFQHCLGHWDICHAFMVVQHDSVQLIAMTHFKSINSCALKYFLFRVKGVGLFVTKPTCLLILWFYKIKNNFMLSSSFNSTSPTAACLRQWMGSALVEIMACRLLGAKPLSEPMLSYCQLDPKVHISVRFI